MRLTRRAFASVLTGAAALLLAPWRALSAQPSGIYDAATMNPDRRAAARVWVNGFEVSRWEGVIYVDTRRGMRRRYARDAHGAKYPDPSDSTRLATEDIYEPVTVTFGDEVA